MEEINYGTFKNRTKIWKYFLRSTAPREGEFAKCILEGDNGEDCNKILSMGKNKSTGALQNHLRGIHKMNWKTSHDDGPDDPLP